MTTECISEHYLDLLSVAGKRCSVDFFVLCKDGRSSFLESCTWEEEQGDAAKSTVEENSKQGLEQQKNGQFWKYRGRCRL